MTRFVVAFFEGAHDAHFVARVLVESGLFSNNKVKVGDLPPPVDRFLVGLYKEGLVEDLTIGKADPKMTPVVALRSEDGASCFLGFATNGVNKTKQAHEVIRRLMAFAKRDDVAELTAPEHTFALMFYFDADDHGRQRTELNFAESYEEKLREYDKAFQCPKHQGIASCAGVPVCVYVFCDGSGTGTLEDCVARLLSAHKAPMAGAMEYLTAHNVDLPLEKNDAAVSSRAKRYKAAFTILGQREKHIAGSSLAVILRDSIALDGAFDFANDPTAKAIKDLTKQLLS